MRYKILIIILGIIVSLTLTVLTGWFLYQKIKQPVVGGGAERELTAAEKQALGFPTEVKIKVKEGTMQGANSTWPVKIYQIEDEEKFKALTQDLTKVDSDGDGLTDEDEKKIGIDPQKKDTDGDGLDDGEEVARGTMAFAKDSDADGLDDGVEVNKFKTDPLKKDTDGDGFSDLEEVIKGYNPNGEGKLP